jgi:release factor glutamine methyltransferase
MQTLKSAFHFGVLTLKSKSPSPELDARILLEESLNLQHLALENPDKLLEKNIFQNYNSLIKRRQKGEPIAYILGKKEFFGLEFKVNPSVLIPRPESEFLAEEAIKILKDFELSSLADVCTGSGCLAISILKHLPNINVVGYDISSFALEVAKINKNRLTPNANLQFELTDVLREDFELNCHVVVSNPPYISTGEMQNLSSTVKDFEPKIALKGGYDGLIFYRQIAKKAQKSRFVLLEIGVNMESDVINIFTNTRCANTQYKLINQVRDLSGIIRVLAFRTQPIY